MTALSDWAAAALTTAQGFVMAGSQVAPTLIARAPEGGIVITLEQYGEPGMKGPIIQAMRQMVRDKNVDHYIFVMEAWFSEHNDFPGLDYLPSKNPSRRECIAVCGANREGEKLLLVSEIIRYEGGSPTFGNIDKPGAEGWGAMLDLFDEPVLQ